MARGLRGASAPQPFPQFGLYLLGHPLDRPNFYGRYLVGLRPWSPPWPHERVDWPDFSSPRQPEEAIGQLRGAWPAYSMVNVSRSPAAAGVVAPGPPWPHSPSSKGCLPPRRSHGCGRHTPPRRSRRGHNTASSTESPLRNHLLEAGDTTTATTAAAHPAHVASVGGRADRGCPAPRFANTYERLPRLELRASAALRQRGRVPYRERPAADQELGRPRGHPSRPVPATRTPPRSPSALRLFGPLRPRGTRVGRDRHHLPERTAVDRLPPTGRPLPRSRRRDVHDQGRRRQDGTRPRGPRRTSPSTQPARPSSCHGRPTPRYRVSSR